MTKQIPISPAPGWGKDYADPSTFMVLFDGRSITAERQPTTPSWA